MQTTNSNTTTIPIEIYYFDFTSDNTLGGNPFVLLVPIHQQYVITYSDKWTQSNIGESYVVYRQSSTGDFIQTNIFNNVRLINVMDYLNIAIFQRIDGNCFNPNISPISTSQHGHIQASGTIYYFTDTGRLFAEPNVLTYQPDVYSKFSFQTIQGPDKPIFVQGTCITGIGVRVTDGLSTNIVLDTCDIGNYICRHDPRTVKTPTLFNIIGTILPMRTLTHTVTVTNPQGGCGTYLQTSMAIAAVIVNSTGATETLPMNEKLYIPTTLNLLHYSIGQKVTLNYLIENEDGSYTSQCATGTVTNSLLSDVRLPDT